MPRWRCPRKTTPRRWKNYWKIRVTARWLGVPLFALTDLRLPVKGLGIPDKIAKGLWTTASAPPRIYGLPKIHKADIPLRPIVFAIGLATYKLAKYLTDRLRPLVGRCDHHKNSADLVGILREMRLTSTYFRYYEQIDAVATWSQLSPAFANFYMEHFCWTCSVKSFLFFFFRYIDDTFVI